MHQTAPPRRSPRSSRSPVSDLSVASLRNGNYRNYGLFCARRCEVFLPVEGGVRCHGSTHAAATADRYALAQIA